MKLYGEYETYADLMAPTESPQIEIGTVGWDDEDGDAHDLGDGSDEGVTLVQVQLYRGMPTDERPQPGRAGGAKIWAQVMGPDWRIPPKGTRVVLAVPYGQYQTPGAAIILGWLGTSPTKHFAKDADLHDQPDKHLVFRCKSVTFITPTNFITVGIAPAGTVTGIGMAIAAAPPAGATMLPAVHGLTGITGTAAPGIWLTT